MDSGAQCVMINLEQQRRGLLAINLGFLEDTFTTQLLVPGEYTYWLSEYIIVIIELTCRACTTYGAIISVS